MPSGATMRDDMPSSTALVIARAIVMAAENRRFRCLVVPGEAEAYLRVIRAYRQWWAHLLLFLRRFELAQRAFTWIESALIPGLTLHFLLRKRAIERLIREAVEDDGVKQVLVLAAGFDTLCLRLRDQYRAVNFIETDHPATQALKRRVFDPGPNHVLVPVDYRVTTLTAALLETPLFRPGARTVVVAEGLLMYLDKGVVDGLFTELKSLIKAPVQLVFTSMDVAPLPRGINFVGQGRFDTWWLKKRGEPFVFGLAKPTVGDWLQVRGWQLLLVEDDVIFRQRHPVIAGLPLAVGEFLVAAKANDS